MKQLNEMGIDEILILLKKKEIATKRGNLSKLIQLKKNYPTIFTKQFEDKLNSWMNDLAMAINSKEFKDFLKKEIKQNKYRSLTVIPGKKES